MSDPSLFPGHQESSPRSTIFVASTGSMTTSLPSIINERNVLPDDASSKIPSQVPKSESEQGVPKSGSDGKDITPLEAKGFEAQYNDPPTPISHEYAPYLHYANASLTPQPATAYYIGYPPPQHHMIPEPDSPAGSRPTIAYDGGPIFHSHAGAAFHPATSSSSAFIHGAHIARTPNSPTKGPTGTPTSPLFTRVSSGSGKVDSLNIPYHGAPNLPYMASPPLLGRNNYQMYPTTVTNSSSSEEVAWVAQNGDAREQNNYAHATMQGSQILYGMPPTRATSGGRAYSFEEAMLPPSVLDDHANPAYSPYGGAHVSPPGGTIFAPQMSWSYGGPPDPYGAPASPLQPRPSLPMNMIPSSPASSIRGDHLGIYGQNYPATSPGHPIQTTASNKGPDGANLFIFHIPNHYTNLDMYHLFQPFGNLLSVRIMVERDSGRSRGFGFVSYDSPESAAMAIKELNGFPVGNKRLKVQHKQIRRQDLQDPDATSDNFDSDGCFPKTSTLPPSGPNATPHLWYDSSQNFVDVDGIDEQFDGEEVKESDKRLEGVGQTDPTIFNANTKEYEDDVNKSSVAGSPLDDLCQLQCALSDISGIGADVQEKVQFSETKK